jgi:hypothetical protein
MRCCAAGAVAALALATAATAAAAPPITCGRISHGGARYVVKSHASSCPFATRSLRSFMADRTSPPLFRCRRYGPNIPAYCIGSGKYSKRYFFATKA